jgi:hypothetical protein
VSGSTIPAALAALTTTLTAALPTTLQITDGPVYDAQVAHLAIGWEDDNTPAVVAVRDPADAAAARNREEYEIACLLSNHTGTTPRLAREALFAQFELIDAAIHADMNLGGAVSRAWVSAYELVPALTEGGATASLRFTVTALAWK